MVSLIKKKLLHSIVFNFEVAFLVNWVIFQDFPLRLLALDLLDDSIIWGSKGLMCFVCANGLDNCWGFCLLFLLRLQSFLVLLRLELWNSVEKLYDYSLDFKK